MRTEFLAYLQTHIGGNIRGNAQGLSNWLDGKLISVSDAGEMVLEFEVRPDMINPYGTTHGGAIAAIMDEVMGMLLYLHGEDNEAFLAINLTTDFIKSSQVGALLTARPQIIKKGRKTATANCQLFNHKNELIAQASSNYMRVDM
jgi:uncharacterized protein (TIGR00369 family)